MSKRCGPLELEHKARTDEAEHGSADAANVVAKVEQTGSQGGQGDGEVEPRKDCRGERLGMRDDLQGPFSIGDTHRYVRLGKNEAGDDLDIGQRPGDLGCRRLHSLAKNTFGSTRTGSAIRLPAVRCSRGWVDMVKCSVTSRCKTLISMKRRQRDARDVAWPLNHPSSLSSLCSSCFTLFARCKQQSLSTAGLNRLPLSTTSSCPTRFAVHHQAGRVTHHQVRRM